MLVTSRAMDPSFPAVVSVKTCLKASCLRVPDEDSFGAHTSINATNDNLPQTASDLLQVLHAFPASVLCPVLERACGRGGSCIRAAKAVLGAEHRAACPFRGFWTGRRAATPAAYAAHSACSLGLFCLLASRERFSRSLSVSGHCTNRVKRGQEEKILKLSLFPSSVTFIPASSAAPGPPPTWALTVISDAAPVAIHLDV
ncbi:hypothetical protein PLICRDRAFT_325437 [Plicaturopsis crispa FD-325 SS-3]|nr:hypothetical protein PLICRDRAFT_325437 [Plicaturopsis crispa FD-325 SS-3]